MSIVLPQENYMMMSNGQIKERTKADYSFWNMHRFFISIIEVRDEGLRFVQE